MTNSSHKILPTAQAALKEGAAKLSANGIDRVRLEAELLLAHVLSVRKEDLILHPDRGLTGPQEEKFLQLVERRCRKEPLAYITGHREFWSLDFKVNPEVLIPRPETEGIIERLTALVSDRSGGQEIHVLDVGTGSGILAVAAAVELPQAQVTAVDISLAALEVARANAHRHRVAERIDFLQMDLMSDWHLPENSRYDFILSNPPYIPSMEVECLMPDIRDYEPRAALDGGPDGLACYRRIIPNAFRYLKPGGHLILEVGESQAGEVRQYLQAQGGIDAMATLQDLSGKERVVSARRTLG